MNPSGGGPFPSDYEIVEITSNEHQKHAGEPRQSGCTKRDKFTCKTSRTAMKVTVEVEISHDSGKQAPERIGMINFTDRSRFGDEQQANYE